MPEVIDVGTFTLFGAGGIYNTPLKPMVAIPGGLFPSNVAHGLFMPVQRTPIQATALANNAEQTIVPASNDSVAVIQMLTLQSSVAGQLELYVSTDLIFTFNIAQDITFIVPLPDCGFPIDLGANDLKVKNVTGSAIDLKVNVAYWYTNR